MAIEERLDHNEWQHHFDGVTVTVKDSMGIEA